MTDEERDELTSFNRVNDYCNKYPLDLAAILGYPAVKTIFDSAFGKINTAAGIQVVDSSGEAPEALLLKANMAKITLKYAKKGRVLSRLAGNTSLTAKLSHPKTFITQAPKETAILNANNIKTALNDNLLICTNVIPANIIEIAGVILAYSNQKNVAREAIQTKAAYGTAIIPEQILIARGAVANFFDLIDAEWEDNVAFFPRIGEFELAKEIITTGHHDIKTFFTVVKDEAPLVVIDNANVEDESNLKSYVADDDTYVVHIYHHRAGHYHFSISAPGRITVDFATDIHKGLNSFTVRLKLIPPPPPI